MNLIKSLLGRLKKTPKIRNETKIKPIYKINGKRVSEEEFLKDKKKTEQEIQKIEDEYKKDKKIIKIEAIRQDNTIFIKHLDKRGIAKKFSTQEIVARIGMPYNLLSEKPTICYIYLGESSATKYLIGDKEVYKCEKCGHTWMKRGDETPLICPKCKTARWNKPQKKKK